MTAVLFQCARARDCLVTTACLSLIVTLVAQLTGDSLAKPDLVNSVGMRFCRVPAGEFQMGAIPGDAFAEEDEKPQHSVVLTSGFLLGQFEVTQAHFRAVMGHNPSWFSVGQKGEKSLSRWTDPDTLPVEMVSWHDATEFCRRLSDLPAERAAGRIYRLPTEAEWEYACRAGTTTRFAFGDTFSTDSANMNQVHEHPLPAGSYPPNAFGLYDMHGNVLEWCCDWHSPSWYAESPVEDPIGPALPDEDHHVLRGGGWAFPAASCSFRDRISTYLKGASHGFRVVCTISP